MIQINSPDQGQRFSTSDDVVASGTGGPVASWALKRFVNGQAQSVNANPTLKNNSDGSWSLDCHTLDAGDYTLSVVATDQSGANVGFSVS